jgi:hypothetical protein
MMAFPASLGSRRPPGDGFSCVRINFAASLTLCVLATIFVPLHAQTSGPVVLPPGTTNSAPVFNQLPSPTPASSQAAPTFSQPIASPSPAPTTPDVSGDIHDIRGPIAIPYEYIWAAYIIGALVAAALGYAIWRFIRSRAKAKAKLPYEIALERLEAARSLMSTESVREYAFTVSEIIRVYIEQCFGEKAARRTTEEFLSDLVNMASSPLAAHRSRLEDFLGHCDLIKFARWGASARELESMHESARVFIVETKPRPDAVQAETKATVPPAPQNPLPPVPTPAKTAVSSLPPIPTASNLPPIPTQS